MYKGKRNIFTNWDKEIYISSKKNETILDDFGNEITEYNKPTLYKFNIQPLSGYSDITAYGEKISRMYKAIIDIDYDGLFKEGDVAYLDGVTPKGEPKNGYNANYRIDSVRVQNLKIAIYFDKLQK